MLLQRSLLRQKNPVFCGHVQFFEAKFYRFATVKFFTATVNFFKVS